MGLRFVSLVLVASMPMWCGPLCEATPQVRVELQEIHAVPEIPPEDFDQNVAPFLALRDRHPGDLFVHERYQDAVHQHGIEGYLRSLTEEYQTLSIQHPRDLMYRYLYVRTLIGRNTRVAIQALNEILAENPDFAPAHRMLAEIYAFEGFRDVEGEKTEREKFLALCPGSALMKRPGPLPDPSPLVDQAERLLAGSGDPNRIAEMAIAGIRADEWRIQRIRPFDWYSVEFKRQNQAELHAKYWKAWSIQVRGYRKAGRDEQAAELLSQMDQRAQLLRASDSWQAFARVAQLYAEGQQTEQAMQKLDHMRQLLEEHPDPNRAAELEQLRKRLGRN